MEKSTVPSSKTGMRRNPGKGLIKLNISLYILLAPAMVLLFIFKYIPMYGIIIAFKDFSPFKGFLGSPWVGLKHIMYFIQDDKFWEVFRNTIILNMYDIIFGFSAPILFALLANEIAGKRFKRVMQTISYLPHFLSWVVVSGIFYQILSPTNGLINLFLNKVLGIESIYFMAEIGLFRGIVVLADIWKSVGWSAILYFSVIAGIDVQLYDAAMIDGAGRFKQTLHVTLPGMVPMIVLLLLLKISHIFTIGFERLYMMQNPLVYGVSDVISIYVYRMGLEMSQFSMTTAVSFVQSLLGLLLLVSANKLSQKAVGMGLY